MIDLKEVLMTLGNKLVLERGYQPATATELLPADSTHMISAFTVWINDRPEVQAVLEEIGVRWSMP